MGGAAQNKLLQAVRDYQKAQAELWDCVKDASRCGTTEHRKLDGEMHWRRAEVTAAALEWAEDFD